MNLRVEINGKAPQPDDLRILAATNYGHFTAMQIENGCVRGLQLHLDRLERATKILFGGNLDRDQVRNWMRHAIEGDLRKLSLRVNVFSRTFNRERPGDSVDVDVLVAVGKPSAQKDSPLRVKSFAFERTLPEVKHIGTFPLFHYRRLAQDAGFDDAVFVDRQDCLSEGSIWNIGFVDNDANVVWPDAPQLRGVSMQLLQNGLARAGIGGAARSVPLANLRAFRAAFFTNSAQPIRAISRIDDVDFSIDSDFFLRLWSCYDSNPFERI